MRPGWKKAAEYADKDAFAPEDVRNSWAAACTDDWKVDVSDSLARSVCDVFGSQEMLFRDQKISDLEAIRRLSAGHGMAHLLIDCAIQQVNNAKSGPDAAVEAVANTLAVWGSRHARQIEEHFCRNSTQRRTSNVRSRLEEASSNVPQRALARQLLKLGEVTVPRKAQKKTGVDDGVSL
jgi:hypothetical protein